MVYFEMLVNREIDANGPFDAESERTKIIVTLEICRAERARTGEKEKVRAQMNVMKISQRSFPDKTGHLTNPVEKIYCATPFFSATLNEAECVFFALSSFNCFSPVLVTTKHRFFIRI